MSAIIVSVEGMTVRRTSGKPKLLVRGRRRKACQKALRALQTLFNQDDFEQRRSTQMGYNPYLVLGTPRSSYRNAYTLLANTLIEALAAKQ